MTGCGRTYHIKGRVVVLPQLGSSESVIAEITGQPIPLGGQPVAGAKVRMIHQFDKNGRPLEGSVWERDVLTDANGSFDLGGNAKPSDNVRVGLEVSKEGYKTAYTIYVDYVDENDDEVTQVFFIVLSPGASNTAMHPTASQR